MFQLEEYFLKLRKEKSEQELRKFTDERSRKVIDERSHKVTDERSRKVIDGKSRKVIRRAIVDEKEKKLKLNGSHEPQRRKSIVLREHFLVSYS